MLKRLLFPLPIVLVLFGLCCVAVTPASAHTTNMTDQTCTVTVENPGSSQKNILLDSCASNILASGGNADAFDVVEIDTFFGNVIGSNSLNGQAQQAVRDMINQHAQDFQNDYQFCHNHKAKLTGYDSNIWNDWGNPSQFVLNVVSNAQFQSGC